MIHRFTHFVFAAAGLLLIAESGALASKISMTCFVQHSTWRNV